MLKKEMRRTQIEEILKDKGDFIAIDYLSQYLKQGPSIDMKKYAYLRLAGIYLNRAMYAEAAKMFRSAAINSLTFREQREHYMREAKSYVKAQKFEYSINALKKAFAEANKKERRQLYDELVEFYKKEGKQLEDKGLPGKATKIYEKLVRMKLTPENKQYAKERLLNLYEKLGKTKEYNFLKSVNY